MSRSLEIGTLPLGSSPASSGTITRCASRPRSMSNWMAKARKRNVGDGSVLVDDDQPLTRDRDNYVLRDRLRLDDLTRFENVG